MAKVHITNVVVLDNPSSFLNPFQFELTFECIEELKEDLEWKMIYVGSAESEAFDQVLDTIYVGPVPEGRHIFVFQADPPNVSRIPEQDAVGVTVVLLTCSYRGQEFVRVGYFINNEYAEPELRENPPPKPLFHKMTRNILASKPRVTRFKINWDDAPANGVAGGPSNGMMDGEEEEGATTDEMMAANGVDHSAHHHDHGMMDGEPDGVSVQQHPPDLVHDENRVGKTTIMRKLSDELVTRKVPISGFYTEELRDTRSGDRLGFDVVTFSGERAPLARVGSRAPSVGRYSVCLAEFERLALPALDARRPAAKTGALLLDEIGRMELKSSAFADRMNAIVHEVAAGKLRFIATIPLKASGMEVVEQLKRIAGCQIFHVKPSNRDALYDEVRKATLRMIATALPR
uniref:Uncharacterized protein n=1 Tax=Anopheles dirus TaxID=7168 RepID=A0A182N8B9_9DIPT